MAKSLHISRAISGALKVIIGTALALGSARADYIGSVNVVGPNAGIQSAGTEILGGGGGASIFNYKGGGNAVDAAVAAALAACVITPDACSLGGYGGHMMIWKSGADGDHQLVTCFDFNSAAGSLASSNMFAGNVNPTNGHWTGPSPAANLYGWKAVGVPGTFAGLFMAQVNYGRKQNGTNFFPFAEILKPALARIADGRATGNAYYTLASVSNLFMDLYTNSPGYTNGLGVPNPFSNNNPYGTFYTGDIAQDIVAAMQTNGGCVTYSDMINYRPRELVPYARHFTPPGGTPAWVYAAPLGSAAISVLEDVAMLEAAGWSNGPAGNWDSLHYWHARAEIARLRWKDHYQWLGDPGSGVLPPDFLGNGSTNFCDQILAHATNGYAQHCPWDANEILLTNSLAQLITTAVSNQNTIPVSVDWDDIRYGTCNISVADRWGNCVAVTLSMGGTYGAQVGVTNRGLVFGQGIALMEPRPGWPNSIAPGKRGVDNMSPIIIVPDNPGWPTNGATGGRPPIAIGGVGGSTIENNMSMQVIKYLMDPPSSPATPPDNWLYNFEANNIIYMQPAYPAGVQSYLGTVGLSAPGGPPSVGQVSFAEAWIAPAILAQPVSTNIASGGTVVFQITASGLPLFYQWYSNGIPIVDGGPVSGATTSRLTVASVTNGSSFYVVVANGGASVTSVPVGVTINGAPTILTQPASATSFIGTPASFSVSAIGSAPLSYQWTKNGSPLGNTGNISGVNTTTLNFSAVSPSDAAAYSVIITNSSGSVTSALATLSVTQANPSAGLVLYEPFAYTNLGQPVSSNTPANWTFGGTGANDLCVATGNLAWPGLILSLGNSVTNGGAGLGVRRLLGTNFNSGKIYFSALMRINDLGFGAWNGQASALGALTATDNTSFRNQVIIKSNSPAGYVIGTQKSGTGSTPTYDVTERHAGDTVFLVGKYDFTLSPNVATLWINPPISTFGATSEPATNSAFATNGMDGFVIDRFNIRQNAATGTFSVPPSIQWDELRFGLTWASVTPPAPPPTLSAFPLTGGSFQFDYPDNGLSYTVYASSNLTQWLPLGAASQISPGLYQFIDTNTAARQRFYQLRVP